MASDRKEYFSSSPLRTRSGHAATVMAQKTVESSVGTLNNYLEMIMDSIFSSVHKCPSLLRLALRQLWLRVAEKFRDHDHVVCMSLCPFVCLSVSRFSLSDCPICIYVCQRICLSVWSSMFVHPSGVSVCLCVRTVPPPLP